MEKEREVERRDEPPPAEAEPTIRVAGTRCPYCHADVPRESADVCRDCLARHHADCWTEGARCGACGSVHVLRPVLPPLTQDRVREVLQAALRREGYAQEDIARALPPPGDRAVAGRSARGVARGSATLSFLGRSHAESARRQQATTGWVLIAAGVLLLGVLSGVAIGKNDGTAFAAGLMFFAFLTGTGALVVRQTRILPPIPPPEADKTVG